MISRKRPSPGNAKMRGVPVQMTKSARPLFRTPSFRRIDDKRGTHGVAIVSWLVTEGDVVTWLEYKACRDGLTGVKVFHTLQLP